MRYVVLPHGLLFNEADLKNGQVVAGITSRGYDFSIQDNAEVLKFETVVMRRPVCPQDVISIPNRIRGSDKDVIRWARRTHAKLFHKL